MIGFDAIFGHRAEGVPFGRVGDGWRASTLTLSTRELATHLHVIGVSGSGKSRFLAGLFLAMLRLGMPVTLVDPHGDLARLVLAHLVNGGFYKNTAAYDRLLYLDIPGALKAGRYLPFNVLTGERDPHRVARNVLEALRRAWPTLDGGVAPAFENAVLAGTFVLAQHGLPLPLLHDLLVDTAWRNRLLRDIDDEAVVGFFHERYDRWGRQQPLLVESTLRRVFLLAFSPVLRYSLAQAENTLDFRHIFQRNQSLIINLALPDADARRLLGCLMAVSAEQAALARADDRDPTGRGTHHLILDEFADFVAQSETSLAAILSHCRKYGLYAVLAHQTWSQASARLRGGLQNVGIEVAFRLGRADAEAMARTLGRVDPRSIKHDLAGTGDGPGHPLFYSPAEQWEEWTNAIQDLRQREAFVARVGHPATRIRTLPVPDVVVPPDVVSRVEAAYLERYFRTAADAEQLLGARARMTPTTTRMRPVREEVRT